MPVPALAWGLTSGERATATAPVAAWPAGAADDVLFLFVGSKGTTASIGTPSGWTPVLAQVTGGGHRVAIFSRTAPAAAAGSVTVSIPSADSTAAVACRAPAGTTFAAASSGADTTVGYGYSATGGSSTFAVDDGLVAVVTFGDDVTTAPLTLTASGGVTLGATSNPVAVNMLNGSDMYLGVFTATVTTGGTGAPTISGTFTGPGTATGLTGFLALRAPAQPVAITTAGARAVTRAADHLLAHTSAVAVAGARATATATSPPLTQPGASPADPYGQLVHSDAPSAWYRFDGAPINHVTGTAAATLAGAAYAGSLLPGHPTGQSVDVDGAGAHVDIPQQPGLQASGDLTVEAWVSWDGLPDGTALIFDGGGIRYGLRLGFLAEPVFYVRPAGGALVNLSSPAGVSSGGRHHLVGVRDGSTIRLHVDGVQVASAPFDGAVDTAVGTARVGAYTNGTQRLDGRVDELAVYLRALSGADVAAHYSAGLGASTIAVAVARSAARTSLALLAQASPLTTRATRSPSRSARPLLGQAGVLLVRAAHATPRAGRALLAQVGSLSVRASRAAARAAAPALANTAAIVIPGMRSPTSAQRVSVTAPALITTAAARAPSRATAPTLVASATLAVGSLRAAGRAGHPMLGQGTDVALAPARAATRATAVAAAQEAALYVRPSVARTRAGAPALAQVATLGAGGSRAVTRAGGATLSHVTDLAPRAARVQTRAQQVALIGEGQIGADGARSPARAGRVLLAQATTISASGARAAVRAAAATLGQVTSLAVRGATARTRAGAPLLAPVDALDLRGARAVTRARSTALEQLGLLAVAGARAPTRASTPRVTDQPTGTPAARTYVIPVEQRSLTVNSDDRTASVTADERTHLVPADNRTTAVPARIPATV